MLRLPFQDGTDADRSGHRRRFVLDRRRCLEKLRGPGPLSLLPRVRFSPPPWESLPRDSGRPKRCGISRFRRSAPSEHRFNFLRLPSEIRHLIYCLLVVRSEAMTVLWRPRAGRSLGILRACKPTWREATPVLYGQNRLDFSKVGPEAAARFLSRIGPRNACNVRHIIVDFPGMRFNPDTLLWDDEPNAVAALAPYAAHCLRLCTLVTSQASTHGLFLDLPQLGYADDAIRAAFAAADAGCPEIGIQVDRHRPDWEFIRFHSLVRGWSVKRERDYGPHEANGGARPGTGRPHRFLLD